MKVRETSIYDTCEGCLGDEVHLNLVIFEETGEGMLLCNNCLSFVRKILKCVGKEEADA